MRGDRLEANVFSQNWGVHGQNWRPYSWPNFEMENCDPRGPHTANLFVPNGNGQHDNAEPNFNSRLYGRATEVGRNAMGPHFGDDSLGCLYGNVASRPRRLSESIRCRPTDSRFVLGPSTNCVGVDRSWQTVPEAPWRTKPRAHVFSVDSSPYDSSQFVRFPPRLPELHASDYFDATAYDSNFNSVDSFVPLGSRS